MPKINRDGVDIYYEIHGSGPPLLLPMAIPRPRKWHGQIEALSKAHKLVLWDMRGHGNAAKVVIPAGGHAVNIDQPQTFIAAVLPFLDSLDARPIQKAAS